MRYDVAIAGGGPAGLTAAALLARAGAKVAVLARPPRAPRRPGETLPGAGLRLLRALDLPWAGKEAGHRPLTGISSAWDTPGLVETDYCASPDGHSWLLNREAFDAALRDAAFANGAEIIPASLAAPPPRSHGWSVELAGRSIDADFLIDAGGRAARLGTGLGACRTPREPEIAWWSIMGGAAPPRLVRPMIERQRDGWWFAIALDTARTYVAFHSARGVGSAAERDLLWHRRLDASRWIGPLVQDAGHAGRVRGCGAGNDRLDRPVGNGWAACGDAAIALDPISSQGILSAMAGGHMLAAALTDMGMSRDAALSYYAERIDAIWSTYAARRKRMMAA